ncbi:hypothetical protein [Tunturiibacter lichenicola]|uniref:hypothetical protein n=1 Tax=Tunturiibacter lichenicola TaxID=2051959 RepID=UPI003D9BEE11
MSFIVVGALGCGKPTIVETYKSPIDGVFYTVETTREHTPVSDTNRVYAHLERHGKSKKLLVLDGGDLTVGRVIWINPHEVNLCIDGGITDTFRNEVTLIIGDGPADSETIHNHLLEHC